mmetsp:Transcript_20399/g.19716  ORF Transcript_20399/g.19716 Transcript_20399/m.19716 type:complete len:315 (+) Transcript_20399:58-1002(+)|eukprot:CAMPEP_0119034034 /NCGR_PEP_ID=MMETSP1177-20130426/1090_1 /TAXON_ID=2985 /ORGANISM="Ochromonas sp, Strain CCMP1899" /LENGTH=314 /DNA_ID=CAMNT_0006991229 /DNA_START=22 /DNA_END=966 /DNA_ORIENTATION=+
MVSFITVLALFASAASAFKTNPVTTSNVRTPLNNLKENRIEATESFQPIIFDQSEEIAEEVEGPNVSSAVLLSAISLLIPFEDANAAGGAYGVFEGKLASMAHPVTMLALFGTSLYSAYLGIQWRRLREIGDELKDLTKQMPKLSSGQAKSPLAEIMTAVNSEISTLTGGEGDNTMRLATLRGDMTLIQGASEMDSKITVLSQTRKDLIGMNLRDKHYTTGSSLLGVGVGVAILGAFNTYMRAGKLFPGPHLYAGMAITGLWAASAALVPEMQKGNNYARTGHIVFNSVNVALFAWQVSTGLGIMEKVWEKAPW